jgi:hypothetical protein
VIKLYLRLNSHPKAKDSLSRKYYLHTLHTSRINHKMKMKYLVVSHTKCELYLVVSPIKCELYLVVSLTKCELYLVVSSKKRIRFNFSNMDLSVQ